MRARPEQTQSEDLSDASFSGKLLVLPANVRLDWKVIARNKHSSLFGLIFCNEEKKFYNIDTWSSLTMMKLKMMRKRMVINKPKTPEKSSFPVLAGMVLVLINNLIIIYLINIIMLISR